MKLKYTNRDSVKVSGTGGGTHIVLGEPTKTFSKTKLLEWVRQQQANNKKWLDCSHSRVVVFIHSSQLDCWNRITKKIKTGDFDE